MNMIESKQTSLPNGGNHTTQQDESPPQHDSAPDSQPPLSSYAKWKLKVSPGSLDGSLSGPTHTATPTLDDGNKGLKTPATEALTSIVTPSPTNQTPRRVSMDVSHEKVRQNDDGLISRGTDGRHLFSKNMAKLRSIPTSPGGSAVSGKSHGTYQSSGTGVSSSSQHSLGQTDSDEHRQHIKSNATSSPSDSSLVSAGGKCEQEENLTQEHPHSINHENDRKLSLRQDLNASVDTKMNPVPTATSPAKTTDNKNDTPAASPPITAKSARSFWISRMSKSQTGSSIASTSSADAPRSFNASMLRTYNNVSNKFSNSTSNPKSSTMSQSESGGLGSTTEGFEGGEQSLPSKVSASTPVNQQQDHIQAHNDDGKETNIRQMHSVEPSQKPGASGMTTTNQIDALSDPTSLDIQSSGYNSLLSTKRQLRSIDRPRSDQDQVQERTNEVDLHDIGEMQIKLDIAEGKCLTLEMRQKDIEEKARKQSASYERDILSLQHQITQFQNDERAMGLEMEQAHESWMKERNELLHHQTIVEKEKHELLLQLKASTASTKCDGPAKDEEIERLNEERALEKEKLISEIAMKHEAFEEQLTTNQDMLKAMKEMDKEIEHLQGVLSEERKLWAAEKKSLITMNEKVLDENKTLDDQVATLRCDVESMKGESHIVDGTASERIGDAESKELQDQLDAKQKDLSSTKAELSTIKKELTEVNLDFRDLAEETHRLEKELEVVTEDRDELLRRSVVYSNSNSNIHLSHMTESPGRLPKTSQSHRRQEKEISRLRKSLQEQEKLMKKKDGRIIELENMVKNNNAFELDISVIDLETESTCTDAIQKETSSRLSPASGDLPPLTKNPKEKMRGKAIDEQKLKVLHPSQYSKKHSQDELLATKQEIEYLREERNDLKVYINDVIRELNSLHSNQLSTRSKNDHIYENAAIQIKELRKLIQDRGTTKSKGVNSNESNEDLNAVVECLETSTNRSTSGPSIECTIKNSPIFGETSESSICHDDNVIQMVLRHMKMMQQKVSACEARKANEKKQLGKENLIHDSHTKDMAQSQTSTSSTAGLSYDDGLDALASNNADFSFQKVREDLAAAKDELSKKETVNIDLRATNFELRKSLQDTMSIAKPLKEFISRTDEEKARLLAELSSTQRKLESKESHSMMAKDSKISDLVADIKDLKQQLKKKDVELREKEIAAQRFTNAASDGIQKKEAEIASLKLEVQELRYRLEASDDILKKTEAGLESIATPKKSNRSQNNRSHDKSATAFTEDELFPNADIDIMKKSLRKMKESEVTLKELLRDSSNRLEVMTAQTERLEREKSHALDQIKVSAEEKETLQGELKICHKEIEVGLRRISELESHQQTFEDNKSNDDLKNEAVANANKRIVELSEELSSTKSKIREKDRSEKKLKQSLEDAVSMLNSLRSHVEVADKERKRIKKQLKAALSQAEDDTSAMNTSTIDVPSQDATFEDATTILHLKSHIVEMEHEIRTLEDRLAELEVCSTTNSDTIRPSVNSHDKVQKLEDKLSELNATYLSTKTMLKKVSDINKELLKDLRHTEAEEVEALEELEILKVKLRLATEEMDSAKYIASAAVRRFSDIIDNQRDSGTMYSESSGAKMSRLGDSDRTLTDVINSLSSIATSIISKNDAVEKAIEEKDKLVRNLLVKLRSESSMHDSHWQ